MNGHLEDLDVGGEEILPLHPLLARHRSHQEGGVDVLPQGRDVLLQETDGATFTYFKLQSQEIYNSKN